MRDERADTDHGGPELCDELHVLRKRFRRLVRRTDHESASGLESDLLQVAQAPHAASQTLARQVKFRIMLRVGGLVPQEITVRARIEQQPVLRAFQFADGQRHGTVRVIRFDRADQCGETFRRICRIFAALKHERAEAILISGIAAFEDFRLVQAVTFDFQIGLADAAVQAVVAADVGKLHDAAHEDFVSKPGVRQFPSDPGSVFAVAIVPGGEQSRPLFMGKTLLRVQAVDPCFVLSFLVCVHARFLRFPQPFLRPTLLQWRTCPPKKKQPRSPGEGSGRCMIGWNARTA